MKKLIILGLIAQLLTVALNMTIAIKGHSLVAATASGLVFGVILSELAVLGVVKYFYRKKWREMWL